MVPLHNDLKNKDIFNIMNPASIGNSRERLKKIMGRGDLHTLRHSLHLTWKSLVQPGGIPSVYLDTKRMMSLLNMSIRILNAWSHLLINYNKEQFHLYNITQIVEMQGIVREG